MGAPPLEAASVSYGHREALGGVGQPLVAAQPEGTALPVEDNAGQFGVGEEGLEDLAGYRPDADHLDLAVGVGAVHHAHEAVKMSWMAALALMPKSSSRASRVVASRLVANSNTTSARRCFGVRTSPGSQPSAPSRRRWCL